MKILRLNFASQCFLALFSGLCIGHIAPLDVINFFAPIGKAFLQLLRFIVIPLTFTTIIASFNKIENMALVKRLGIRIMFWFLLTGFLASIIGILAGKILKPGTNLNIAPPPVKETATTVALTLKQILLSMLPGNIFSDIMSGNVISVIIFALFIGIVLVLLRQQTHYVREFFSETSQVMLKITNSIIKFSPLGIFALVMQMGHEYGLTMILHLVVFIASIYLACFLQFIIYAILLLTYGRRNPIKFFKQISPALLTGFNTASTLGTLPTTLRVLINEVKIRPIIANFVVPLASSMKMDGGAIYPAVLCIFTANMLHIDLTTHQYFLIIIASTIASIGTAGVPGASFIMATVVLSAVGLPLEGVTLVIGIDRVLDMVRTMTNVGAGTVCTALINKSHTKYETRIITDREIEKLIKRNV